MTEELEDCTLRCRESRTLDVTKRGKRAFPRSGVRMERVHGCFHVQKCWDENQVDEPPVSSSHKPGAAQEEHVPILYAGPLIKRKPKGKRLTLLISGTQASSRGGNGLRRYALAQVTQNLKPKPSETGVMLG
jgi:hypothetical protein